VRGNSSRQKFSSGGRGGFEAVIMAVLLAHEKRVGEIITRLEELGGESDV
jgi:hypothetical protein